MNPVAAPTIIDAGDAALLVVYGETVDVTVNERVHRLAHGLRARHTDDDRWGRPVPGYASLLVPYDPLRISADQAREDVAAIVGEVAEGVGSRPTEEPDAPLLEILVRYGGTDGPDLPEVARRLGLDEAAVIGLHAGAMYRVFMLGFTPGFPYLGPLPDALVLPRRSTPRIRVPAGSVAIAGAQTGVYPVETPGGWHLIGRTDLPLWDPSRRPPTLLEPGGRVRFVPG